MTDDLIARLEKATGPDRELDALIHRTVTPEYADMITGELAPGWLAGGDHALPVKAPNYTTSLDAALTLVPEEWEHGYSSYLRPGGERFIGFARRIVDRERYITANDIETDAVPTPALALVIAALRAREAARG